MVGISRKIITTIVALICATNLFGQSTLGSFAERQMRQLTLRAERLSERIELARNTYATTPSDSVAMVIHELEKQAEAIRGAIQRLNALPAPEPSEEVVAPEEPTSPTPDTPAIAPTETPLESTTSEVVTEASDPTTTPEPEITAEEPEEETTEPAVSEELKALFKTTVRRYEVVEQEIAELIATYALHYDTINISIKEYHKATNLPTLNDHYNRYLSQADRCATLANTIADRSDQLFASKTKSLFIFADTLGLSGLRTEHTAATEQMEARLSEKLAGESTDLDLALYPHRLKATIELEKLIASHIDPELEQTFANRLANLDTTHTLFAPISAPKRSDAKFAPVKVVKSKEKAVSDVPLLKIPAKGELYSITVANYASLPPSTKVFRGATPLYRYRREDGRTYICIGLYPTALSAQEDVAYLKKIGFKQPTLMMWRDGIRRDDFVDRNSTPSAPKAAMYRVEIAGGATLSEPALSAIRTAAPRKEISKFTTDGTTTYTVGIFTKIGEAEELALAIEKADGNFKATVVQIGAKN